MPEPSPLARARRIAPVVVVFAVLALSHWDRLYMYGDDVNKLSPGRALPLPEYGNYIGSRVVDNYFIGYLFEAFRAFVAPALGLRHVVDVHSAYSTLLYAASGVAVVGALFALSRLAVALHARHFVVFALAANVLALQPTKMMAVTGTGSFQVPLALSLWLLVPVLQWTLTGRDPFAGRSAATSHSLLVSLAFLVAFSVTNVAYFTVAVVVACGALVLMRGRGPLLARLGAAPSWFRLIVVALPLLVAVATFYDVTSGRFADEQRREFGAEDFAPLSLARGLAHLPLSNGRVLDIVVLASLVAAAGLVAREARRRPEVLRPRVVACLAALGPAFVVYALFLQRISNLGGKDYFVHPGMSAYFVFALAVAVLGGLFALSRGRGAPLATAALALLAVHGVRQLAEVPSREVSKAEVKGIFDSLFMCHAYGEERVPVFLRSAPLGWPYGAAEEGWYLDAYRRAFREHVVGYGGFVAPGYAPVFHRVDSVDALHAELAAMQRTRPLLHLGLEASPYFIDTRDARDVAAR